jgi:Fe-S-cluster containining protein
MDCSRFVPGQCKAYCCTSFPIEKNLYVSQYFNRQRPVIREDEIDDQFVLPITSDGYCCFLSSDYKCVIYEDRPTLCRDFGKGSTDLMKCPFMDSQGKDRSEVEKKRLLKIQRGQAP